MSESGFARFLTNNDPPSEEVFEKAEKILANLNPLREISELESRIADLKAAYFKYQTVTSFFRRIPDDVLYEIFYQCLPSHRNPLLTASEAPVLLTRVCRCWRAVALASPRLWAQMHITFSNAYRPSESIPDSFGMYHAHDHEEEEANRMRALQILDLRCNVVQEWLARSGSCPLSLSIIHSNPKDRYRSYSLDNWGEDDPTMRLFRMVARSLHRCRSLTLDMPFEIYQKLAAMIGIPVVDLPVLVDLNVTLDLLHTRQSNASTRVKLLEVPHLKRISLGGPAMSLSHLLIVTSARGESLTHLSSDLPLTAKANLDILGQCKNLVYCKIYVTHCSHSHSQELPGSQLEMPLEGVVSLPHLTSISIREHIDVEVNCSQTSAQLYSRLDVPQLRCIEYRNQLHLAATFQARCPIFPISLLLRLARNLEKLSIDPTNFLQGDLRKALEIVSPTLKHLVLGHGHDVLSHCRRRPIERYKDLTNRLHLIEWLVVDVNTVSGPDFLCMSNSSITSLPLLPRLTLLESSVSIGTDEELLRFIKSRLIASSFSEGKNKVARLKFIRTLFTRRKQLEVQTEVARFAEETQVKRDREAEDNISEPTLNSLQDAVTELKLDIEYLPYVPASLRSLSTSYGTDKQEEEEERGEGIIGNNWHY